MKNNIIFNKEELMAIADCALVKANKLITKYEQNPIVIDNKNKDIKTIADVKINEIILNELNKTSINILSEETYNNKNINKGLWWIIDPLDGTHNFSRKFPCVGISIALYYNLNPILGIIRDIYNKKTFKSLCGKYACVNSSKLKVSTINKIENATLATGFPSGSKFDKTHLDLFINCVQKFKKIRSLGSASIMLSYVSSGVFDVYYEKDIYIWDVAAGLSLINEAGGKYYIRQTGENYKYEVLASNSVIFSRAKKLLIK
jgi:myo-inositol-1(or 4)-monophosphatase